MVTARTPHSLVARLAREERARDIATRALALVFRAVHIASPFDSGEAGESRADYYEAWLARIQDRTYPNDTLSEDAYIRAVERRLAMPRAPFAPAQTLTTRPMGKPFRSDSAGLEGKGGPPNPGDGDGTGAGLWELVGPRNLPVPYNIYYGPSNSITTGRIGGIAFDPTHPSTIYMTGPSGGVFKTTNAGTNWRSLGNGFVYPYVGPIAVSPLNPNLVLIGTGDFDGGVGSGYGLLRSVDGGESWEWVAKDTIRNVNFSSVWFDPTTPGRVLAVAGRGTSASNGLWESLDEGLTWARKDVAGSISLSFTSLSSGPIASNGDKPMFAASNTGGTGTYGVYESRDGGRNWSRITSYPQANRTSGRTQVAASATDPNVVYAVEGAVRKIYKGTRAPDGNWSWTDLSSGFPNGTGGTNTYNWSQYTYDEHIASVAHTVNGLRRDTVYVGLITIASYDGASWTDLGRTYFDDSRTHNDQHCFAFAPSDPTKMAFGNDGGIYDLQIDTTGTQTVNPRSSGDTSLAMFYTGAWHPTDPNRMIGGTQDNASPTAVGDLQNWANRTGGDGAGTAIDFALPSRQYGSAQYAYIYRTTDAWSTSSFLRANWPESMPFISRMATDRSPAGYLYVGGSQSLYRFDPGTSTWTDRIGGSPFIGQVRAIAPAPSDPNTIYVGTTSGGVYVSTDRGTSWRTIELTSSLGVITSFAVHPTRPYDVLMTGGNGPVHVYRYADTRVATPVRTSVAGAGGGALPDIFSSSVARNADRPDTDWYLATDVGVFGTSNGGASWFNMTEPLGLPPVEASAIEHTPGTGYLNLATYGRGMWRLKLDANVGGTTLKVVGSLIRTAPDVVALRVQVNNTGTVAARQVQVLSSNMVIGSATLSPFTPLPITLGRIEPASSDVQTITFRDSRLTPGQTGVATVRVEWLSGNETKTLDVPIRFRLP